MREISRRSESFIRAMTMAFLGFFLIAGGQKLTHENNLTTGANVLDYRVVACGTQAVLHGQDPYLTEPLRGCEHAFGLEPGEPTWAVTPFALPPYSAAILAPFGALDFHAGRVLWYGLILLATCLTIAATAQIIRAPTFGVALIMAPTVGLLNLRFGETVPFAIAAAALAGLALEKRRYASAGIFAGLALLEPAIGLPAVLGLFVLEPRARGTLAGVCAGLATIGVLAFGIARNFEYVVDFLPAHEHAELLASDQYSLTHLAYEIGASAHLASLAGSISYAIAVVVGILLARQIMARSHALIVLLPVGLSMFGGPFVHDVEIAAALPAAVVLARDSRIARVAVMLLSVSWTQYWRLNLIPLAATAIGSALLYLRSTPKRLAFATVTFVLLMVTNFVVMKPNHASDTVAAATPHILLDDLSSIPWQLRIESSKSKTFDKRDPLVKIPTWFGLLMLPVGALALRKRNGMNVDEQHLVLDNVA